MKKMLISIILATLSLHATADPYINVKLTPVATNYEGDVLFRTYSDINTYGSIDCTNEKFGWLVVSSVNNIWDERIAYDTSEIFDDSCNYKDKKRYNAYKMGKFSLKNPDKTLAKILDKYYFNRSINESNERLKVLELKPKQSCFLNKCIDKVLLQKSIDGFISKKIISGKNSKSLRSSFYYKGVALIRQPFFVDDDIRYDKQGADNPKAYKQVFNLPSIPKGRSYKASFIDSIVLLKPFKFREPTAKVKSEITEAVYDILTLLQKATVKSIEDLNRKYIHKKYGFYLLYRMGACDRIVHYTKLDAKSVTKAKKAVPPYDKAIYYLYEISGKFNKKAVQWEEVAFSCETSHWSKRGIFVHDNRYSITSGLCDFKSYPEKEKMKIKFLTKDTLVVTITEEDITLELKKIDGRWYIVLINAVKTDCSA